MEIKVHCTLPSSPEQGPHHQMQFSRCKYLGCSDFGYSQYHLSRELIEKVTFHIAYCKSRVRIKKRTIQTKTIQVRGTRHAGHCWRSKDELISDVLLWTPTYNQAKAGRPARTYIQQLCEDTGCSPEDLPEAMNDREKWRERVRDIRASGTTWWWWWWWRWW